MVVGALLMSTLAQAQTTTSITGVITTGAKGAAPVRVTIDQKVCGDQLPDEAIVVDAQGRLANAVVIVTGLKRGYPSEPIVTNEKCRFGPRVQVIAYPDGRRVQAVNLCFEARPLGNEAPTTPHETLATGWFAPDALPDPLVPIHEIRIRDAVAGDRAARIR